MTRGLQSSTPKSSDRLQDPALFLRTLHSDYQMADTGKATGLYHT